MFDPVLRDLVISTAPVFGLVASGSSRYPFLINAHLFTCSCSSVMYTFIYVEDISGLLRVLVDQEAIDYCNYALSNKGESAIKHAI